MTNTNNKEGKEEFWGLSEWWTTRFQFFSAPSN